MKNTRKGLLLVCAMILLISSLAITISAVKAGDGVAIYEYESVKRVMLETVETGSAGYNLTVAAGNAKPRALEAGEQAKDVQLISIETDGKGAPYVYDPAGTKSSKNYINVNYFNKASGDQNLYIQMKYAYLRGGTVGSLSNKNDPVINPDNGVILEFDIATLNNNDAGYNHKTNTWSPFVVQAMNTTGASEGIIDLFQYKAENGVASIWGSGGSYSSSSPFKSAQNGWLHITIVANPDTNKITTYAHNATESDPNGTIERVLISEVSNYDTAAKVNVFPMQLRLGRQGDYMSSAKGIKCQFSLDNFLMYESKKVCDPDKLDKMTDDDKFIANVDVLNDDVSAAAVKYEIYQNLRDNYIGKYYAGGSYTFDTSAKPALKTAVDTYVKFINDNNGNDSSSSVKKNLTSVTEAAKNENSATFASKVDEISGRGIANIGEREKAVSQIEEFLEKNAKLINTNTTVYTDAHTLFELKKAYLADDILMRTFKNRMEKFANAYALKQVGSMQKHLSVAKDAEGVATQLAATSFADYTVAAEKTALQTAWSDYNTAQAKISTIKKGYNSERFMGLVNLFAGLTKEQFLEDDGTIRNQWYLARAILAEGDYDADYSRTVSGVQETFAQAKTAYDAATAVIWEQLHVEHFDILDTKLKTFELPEATFIDKKGVVTFVENYLVKHADDMDTADSRIVDVKNRLATYKGQLSGLQDDYEQLLITNTIAFKEKMDAIANYTSYQDILPLFNTASDLYYTMNVCGNDKVSELEIKAAIDSYNTVKLRLMAIEFDCKAFNAAIEELKALEPVKSQLPDDYFTALLNAYKSEGNLDVTYKDVAANKATYDVAKAAYISDTTLANSESMNAQSAIGAVRAGFGLDGVVDYVLDLIK